MARPEIRYIEWIDSAATGGWESAGALEDFGVSICRSVGFVLRENDDEVLLAQSEDTRHGNRESVIAIPTCSITKSRAIRKAKP